LGAQSLERSVVDDPSVTALKHWKDWRSKLEIRRQVKKPKKLGVLNFLRMANPLVVPGGTGTKPIWSGQSTASSGFALDFDVSASQVVTLMVSLDDKLPITFCAPLLLVRFRPDARATAPPPINLPPSRQPDASP
jgi:hypothetical protein